MVPKTTGFTGRCLLAAHTPVRRKSARAPRGSHLACAGSFPLHVSQSQLWPRPLPALAPPVPALWPRPLPRTLTPLARITPTGAPGASSLPNHVPSPGGWTTRALRDAGLSVSD